MLVTVDQRISMVRYSAKQCFFHVHEVVQPAKTIGEQIKHISHILVQLEECLLLLPACLYCQANMQGMYSRLSFTTLAVLS